MNPLVAPSWLASRLRDPLQAASTIVFDATLAPVGVTPPVDAQAHYVEEHIPGALFFDMEELSDQTTTLPHMLPTPEDFSRSMSSLGVNESSTIVIYEQHGVFSAPRAWWMLCTLGARHVYLLDGGLRAWRESGLPVESGRVHRGSATSPARFEARVDSEAVVDLAGLKKRLARHQQVLDARSGARFNGTAPEPRPGLSSGHMPGAINVPYTELLEDGRLRPADQLREYFRAKDIDLQQPITTTCGSGVTAAVVALALGVAGARKVSLYDGSWAEYAQQTDSVIEPDRKL